MAGCVEGASGFPGAFPGKVEGAFSELPQLGVDGLGSMGDPSYRPPSVPLSALVDSSSSSAGWSGWSTSASSSISVAGGLGTICASRGLLVDAVGLPAEFVPPWSNWQVGLDGAVLRERHSRRTHIRTLWIISRNTIGHITYIFSRGAPLQSGDYHYPHPPHRACV